MLPSFYKLYVTIFAYILSMLICIRLILQLFPCLAFPKRGVKDNSERKAQNNHTHWWPVTESISVAFMQLESIDYSYLICFLCFWQCHLFVYSVTSIIFVNFAVFKLIVITSSLIKKLERKSMKSNIFILVLNCNKNKFKQIFNSLINLFLYPLPFLILLSIITISQIFIFFHDLVKLS